MANIWHYHWTEPTTQVQRRMEIFFPGSIGDDPQTLNDNAVVGIETGYGMKDWPHGLATPTGVTLTFAMNNIPTELAQVLQGGGYDISDGTSLAFNGDLDIAYQLDPGPILAGPVIDVFRTEDAGVTWVRSFMGCIDIGSKRLPDDATDTLKVDVVTITQAVLKSITLDNLRDALYLWAQSRVAVASTDVETRTCVLDWLWYADYAGTNRWWYIAHVVKGDNGDQEPASTFWGVDREKFAERLYQYMKEVFVWYAGAFVNAGSTYTDDVSGNLLALRNGFRKQRYDTSVLPGDEISDRIYNLLFITNDDFATAELNYSAFDELRASYPSLYDLIVDLCDEAPYVTSLTVGGDDSEFVLSLNKSEIGYGATSVDVQEKTSAYTIEQANYVCQTASASTEYTIDNDTPNVDATIQAGRNDAGRTIVVVTNTSPVAIEKFRVGVDGVRDAFSIGRIWGTTPVRFARTIEYSAKPRLWGYYYMENPSNSPNAFAGGPVPNMGTPGAQFIRCHTWLPILNATVPSTADHEKPSGDARNPEQATWGEYLAGADQLLWSPLRLIAERYNAEFGDPSGSKFTCTVELRHLPVDAAFIPNLFTLVFDRSVVKAWSFGCPTVWYPVSVKCDLIKGTAEIECWGKL